MVLYYIILCDITLYYIIVYCDIQSLCDETKHAVIRVTFENKQYTTQHK